MDYGLWIERERRIRIRLLQDWPEARIEGIYRVCQSCGEICLCQEDTCPNCRSDVISKEVLDEKELLDGNRIRCLKRYQNLI